jgi:ABC-type oligopeptide transport system ATPase subunit
MRQGRIIESLTREQLAAGRAEHPYTRSLLAAAEYLEPSASTTRRD